MYKRQVHNNVTTNSGDHSASTDNYLFAGTATLTKTDDAANEADRKPCLLYTSMLGKFQVIGMNGELGIEHKCPKRIIKLMAYIFSHHKENLPILKIADALYADEEIANPVAAARNLIWRRCV